MEATITNVWFQVMRYFAAVLSGIPTASIAVLNRFGRSGTRDDAGPLGRKIRRKERFFRKGCYGRVDPVELLISASNTPSSLVVSFWFVVRGFGNGYHGNCLNQDLKI